MNKIRSYKIFALGCTVALTGLATFPAHALHPAHMQASSAHPALIDISDKAQSDAKAFISSLTQEGIEFLSDKELSDEEREKEFRSFLTKSFDMKTIGRFVLGRYWKQATSEEQKEYLDLFEDMIVEIYSRRFGEYDGQKIDVRSTRPEGKKDVTVTSMIISDNNTPEIQVDWRVRANKSGKLKVIDVIVEGVSMSLTQRSDFSSVIQRGGGKVEVLLEHLRKATK